MIHTLETIDKIIIAVTAIAWLSGMYMLLRSFWIIWRRSRLTPTNARLKKMAANQPPPPEWFEGDEEELF